MKLIDIFNQLTYGELFQLAVGGADASGILPEDYPQIMTHINLALLEMYKRFPLKINEVTVQQYEQLTTYYLDSRYAESNLESTEEIKYITDSVYKPFQDDVLRIEQIYDECGAELFVNDTSKYWSVYVTEFNAIHVPLPDSNNAMDVSYRAAPVKLPLTGFDPETLDVALPLSHLEPFLLYIAARYYAGMPGTEAVKGAGYMAKYEMACQRIIQLNLVPTDNTANTKLERTGWV